MSSGGILMMKGGEIMKKIIVCIVSLLFLLSVAGLSFAAEKETVPAPAKVEKKTPCVHGKHLRGKVTAVDVTAKTITVKSRKGEVILSIDDKTKFSKDKTIADVNVGDWVFAKCKEMDGKLVASKVKARTSHAHKKAKMKDEKKEEKK
jgi:hypothetical protein